MENLKGGFMAMITLFVSGDVLLNMDIINKFLAAAVSICLIIYYIKKIFKKDK